jgi:nucleotide-binding universal stress UspA family protein
MASMTMTATSCHDAYSAGAQSTSRTGRIVVGVDGSPSSLAALRWAARQAHRSGESIEAVMVFEPPPTMVFAAGGYPAVTGVDAVTARARAERALEAAVAATVGAEGVDVRPGVVADASATRALTRVARGAAMLVVGAHHHGPLGVLLGSTASACLRHAACPVVVVPAETETGRAEEMP